MADPLQGREEIERFLAATRKGWRTVAVNVLNDLQSLPRGQPVSRELVLNLRSVTEQLERELRATIPESPIQSESDPLAGLSLYSDDDAAA